MNRKLALIAAAGLSMLLLAPPHTIRAQSLELQRRLAAAKRLDCTFSALATGTWDDDETPSVKVTPTDLNVTFSDINVDEGTAEADSDYGSSFISVRYSQGYLHLMQISSAGPLRVTTVLAQETSNGRMKAVQTRHEYTSTALPGFTSRPEMYVGDCAVSD
jgi:hypothetical protein